MYIEYDEIKKRKVSTPKEVTPEKALMKLMRLCSTSEKCEKDCIELLKRWGVNSEKHCEIIKYLTENRYVDNVRYASSYVRDKSNYSSWGVAKIRMGLVEKGINKYTIEDAMGNIDNSSMQEKIEREIAKKAKGMKYKDYYDFCNKLLRFAYTRGYDMNIAKNYINNLGKNKEY